MFKTRGFELWPSQPGIYGPFLKPSVHCGKDTALGSQTVFFSLRHKVGSDSVRPKTWNKGFHMNTFCFNYGTHFFYKHFLTNSYIPVNWQESNLENLIYTTGYTIARSAKPRCEVQHVTTVLTGFSTGRFLNQSQSLSHLCRCFPLIVGVRFGLRLSEASLPQPQDTFSKWLPSRHGTIWSNLVFLAWCFLSDLWRSENSLPASLFFWRPFWMVGYLSWVVFYPFTVCF